MSDDLTPLISGIDPLKHRDPVVLVENDWRPKGPQPDTAAVEAEMERHRVNIDKTGVP